MDTVHYLREIRSHVENGKRLSVAILKATPPERVGGGEYVRKTREMVVRDINFQLRADTPLIAAIDAAIKFAIRERNYRPDDHPDLRY